MQLRTMILNNIIALMKKKVKLILRRGLVKVFSVVKGLVVPLDFENYYERQVVHFPFSFSRKQPKFSGSLHYKFYPYAKGIQTESEQTFIYLLDDVRVFSSTGFVISKFNKVVSDTNNKDDRFGYLFDNIFLRNCIKVKGRSLAIAAKDASSNYFHWMTDSLPKIGIAEKAGYALGEIDTVLVSSDLLPFQKETLMHFGINKESRISLSNYTLLKCDELVMPSATCLSGNVSPWIIDFLRLSFNRWMQSDNNLPSNIFIGRKKAKKRLLLNEEEVSSVLEKNNFKTIYLEELTVKDQIKIFYNAKKIISVHGAGLTNLLFSQAGCFVLELFPVNYVNQCYWTISAYNELDYSYLLGEGIDITDEISHLIDGDFSISIEKILHILEISKL